MSSVNMHMHEKLQRIFVLAGHTVPLIEPLFLPIKQDSRSIEEAGDVQIMMFLRRDKFRSMSQTHRGIRTDDNETLPPCVTIEAISKTNSSLQI